MWCNSKIRDAKIIATEYKKDVTPLLTREESELSVIQSIIRMSTRSTIEHKLGKILYPSTVYERVTRATMYLFNDERRDEDHPILLMLFDKTADHEGIINTKILPFLRKRCRT
jgi:hypothetical protein